MSRDHANALHPGGQSETSSQERKKKKRKKDLAFLHQEMEVLGEWLQVSLLGGHYTWGFVTRGL